MNFFEAAAANLYGFSIDYNDFESKWQNTHRLERDERPQIH